METVKQLLYQIYGRQQGERAFERLQPLLENTEKHPGKHPDYFSEKDIYLITYGDTLTKADESPLKTFNAFAADHFSGIVSTVHFLPFFPYSSDDGFSVVDFFQINPDLGSWEDVQAVGGDFQIMVDFVINHFSAKSDWFSHFLDGRDGYRDFAIETDPAIDLSEVTRPRALPLLSEFTKSDGQPTHVWTTFSADQIDFNYQSLDVLVKMVEVLLFYVQKNTTALRLDAIAYLWKEIGTTCIHLPQTHAMVKLFRAILDIVAPHVILITETNVPHPENISYFGNGRDEAQMVYNFTLPPLLFHTFAKEDASALTRWAKQLEAPSAHTTFFNFTASHDGIGVRPLEGVLARQEIDDLATIALDGGGQVSYKRNPDGSESPYELNITYIDAILSGNPDGPPEKFLASQAIQYVLPGVPATYIHSLLGSRNWYDGVKTTGRARTINRQQLDARAIEEELARETSFRARIFHPYRHLMRTRRNEPAFHPNADFEVLDLDPSLFAVKRQTDSRQVLALTNVSSKPVSVSLKKHTASPLVDLLSGREFDTKDIILPPYQSVWLAGPSQARG